MDGGLLKPEAIADGLGCRRLAGPIRVVDSVSSSNDVAWQQVEAGAGDGAIVFAEHQTTGRGRFGRTWESPRGASVLCSVVVDDRTSVLQGGVLSLVSAIAACDAIRGAVGIPAEIRWPNDLLIRERKVGGVLVESRPGRTGGRTFVAGIGINCLQHSSHFPSDLRERATSLDLESPAPIDRVQVCRLLLQQLDGWLAGTKDASPQSVRDAWCNHAVGLGERVRLRRDGKEFAGVVVDLDPTAALIVQLDRGGRALFDAESTTILDS